MFTSSIDDSIDSQINCKQKFIISSINQLISDSNDLVFTKLLLIECIECQQRFENLLDNYKHYLDKHSLNNNIEIIELNVNQETNEKTSKLKSRKNSTKIARNLSKNKSKKEVYVFKNQSNR